jgi:hypothetical protein
MRYTRLRRQIESGTLIGTHGTPFLSTTSPISTSGKRKRLAGEDEEEEGWKKEGEVKGEAERRGVKREKGGGEGKVKVENGDGDSGWQSGSETTGSEGWDSEDEVPLAKLRKGRLENSASSLSAPISNDSYKWC